MVTVSAGPRFDAKIPLPPSTAREFSRNDNVAMYTEVYENRLRPHVITFTTALRDSNGRVLHTQVEERKATIRPDAASTYAFVTELGLDPLTPGDYSVHIEARSSLADDALSRDIPITVR
jgi:hypothetical protein